VSGERSNSRLEEECVLTKLRPLFRLNVSPFFNQSQNLYFEIAHSVLVTLNRRYKRNRIIACRITLLFCTKYHNVAFSANAYFSAGSFYLLLGLASSGGRSSIRTLIDHSINLSFFFPNICVAPFNIIAETTAVSHFEIKIIIVHDHQRTNFILPFIKKICNVAVA